MRTDLHMHSWVSDGDVAPAEVVRLAVRAGLDVIALTDHDTAGGVHEALAEAKALPITVVPGIEISTRWEETELHILGYWINPAAPSIQDHQRRSVQRRYDRMCAMVERLRALGLDITVEDVQAAAGDEVQVLGRPHLARALHQRGLTRFYGEAFSRYIGDQGPAYVAEGFPDPQYAIDTIHAAGGVAVWAHPPPLYYEEALPLFVDWGIDGIECFRPGLDPADVAMFEHGARGTGLFVTGGSDWHGPERSRLGEFAVEGRVVAEMLSRGGLRAPSA